jgi:hypothetical protein
MAEKLGDEPILNLQGIPLPLESLRMKSQLYYPTPEGGSLHENPRQRRVQVLQESRKVLQMMNQMLAELDGVPTPHAQPNVPVSPQSKPAPPPKSGKRAKPVTDSE